jgi:hypothetical protein
LTDDRNNRTVSGDTRTILAVIVDSEQKSHIGRKGVKELASVRGRYLHYSLPMQVWPAEVAAAVMAVAFVQRVVEGMGESFTDVRFRKKMTECFLPALFRDTVTWTRRMMFVFFSAVFPESMPVQFGTPLPRDQLESLVLRGLKCLPTWIWERPCHNGQNPIHICSGAS